MELNQLNSIFQLCVDRVEPGVIAGRVLSQRLAEPLAFTGMASLLLALERLMDRQGFPQAYQRIRSFDPALPPVYGTPRLPDGAMSQEQVESATGLLSTFQLHIFTRQNATWQGDIRWSDGQAVDFASDLEFLALVEQKLSE